MRIDWKKKELELLSRMDIPFDAQGDLTDEKIEDLYDIVPDYMLEHTDTGDDHSESDFNICEDIITKLANIMEPKGLLS